jgi:hypothetical protein
VGVSEPSNQAVAAPMPLGWAVMVGCPPVSTYPMRCFELPVIRPSQMFSLSMVGLELRRPSMSSQ